MGYLDALAALLKKCRSRCRVSAKAPGVKDESAVPMWKERGARVALIMASQMVEMKVCNSSSRLSVSESIFLYRNYQPQSNYSNPSHINLKQVQRSSLP